MDQPVQPATGNSIGGLEEVNASLTRLDRKILHLETLLAKLANRLSSGRHDHQDLSNPVPDSVFDSEMTDFNINPNRDILADHHATFNPKDANNIMKILCEIKIKLSTRDDSIINSLSRIVEEKSNNEIIKKLKEETKEANETIDDIKTKLNLKEEMLKLYEKQQNEIMDILGLSTEDRSFSKVLIVIKGMKESLNEKADQSIIQEKSAK